MERHRTLSTPAHTLSRRRATQALAAGAASLALPGLAQSQAGPVRIGYAIARTGP